MKRMSPVTLMLLLILNSQFSTVLQAQGTAFTYQGRLQNNGGAANGTYNLTFTLFNANATGITVAGPVTNNGVNITNGLFTVPIDFGSGVWNGQANWLEIGVESNGVSGFTILTPRQELTPAPYAIAAGNFIGVVPDSDLPGFQSPDYDTIGGGSGNTVSGEYATVSGGLGNQASAPGAFVGGGGYDGFLSQPNLADGTASVVGGGLGNTAGPGGYATVAGGLQNTASGFEAAVDGGYENVASGEDATVAGGNDNTASNVNSFVAGGEDNVAGGQYSFAAGIYARALHDDSFVWADGESGTPGYSSDRPSQFKIQAAGGVQMDVSGSSGLNPAALHVSSTSGNGVGLWVTQNSSDATAVFTASGTGDIIKGFSGSTGGNLVFEVVNNGTVYSKGVALTSDRNKKENFTAINPQHVLDKVTALPISQWNYKTDPADQKHLGPMAQDFQAAFGLNGQDDTHISVVDEGGVALAAIQGLNQKLEAENAQLKQQNDLLGQRLSALEQAVKALTGKK